MLTKLSFCVATPEVSRSPISWVGWAPEMLRHVAGIGYAGVELQMRDPDVLDQVALARDLRAADLAVAGISTGPVATEDGLRLIAADQAQRERARDRLLRVTEVAAAFGTHMTIGSVRGSVSAAADTETAMSWLSAGLEPVLNRAEQLGVVVVLEPQNRQVTDLFNTVAETVAYIDLVASPMLALEADAYHMALEERSVPAALVLAHKSGRLHHVQISDTNRLAPGWGHLNWADFFGTLQALAFDGWTSVEAAQLPDSAAAARQGHDLVRAMVQVTRGAKAGREG